MLKKISFVLFFGVTFVLSSSMSREIGDEGFRYNDGKCVNEAGQEGYNSNYFGQCAFFRDATLGGLNLDGIDFSGSVFTKADLRLSSLNRAKFIGANLDGAKLVGNPLSEADFSAASMVGTDLSNATADSAIFDGANMQDAVLVKANLSFAELNATNLNSAKLDEANLNDAVLIETVLEKVELKKAKLNNTDLTKAKLSEANFTEAETTGCNFTGTSGEKMVFEKALLRNARLENVTFKNVSFESARLEGANLKNSDFQDSSMRNAVAIDAKTDGIKLAGVDLRSADFSGTDLVSATLTGAKFNRKTKIGLTREEAESMGMIYIGLYEFEGIAQNLPEVDLDGWKKCHTSKYNEGIDFTKLKTDCNGEYVMYACRQIGMANFNLAAYGARSKVFEDTGANSDKTVTSNGVKFYYHETQSFGFAPADLPVNKSTCDFRGDKPEMRFCVHGSGSGYRCGNNDLNGNVMWERVFYTTE